MTKVEIFKAVRDSFSYLRHVFMNVRSLDSAMEMPNCPSVHRGTIRICNVTYFEDGDSRSFTTEEELIEALNKRNV